MSYELYWRRKKDKHLIDLTLYAEIHTSSSFPSADSQEEVNAFVLELKTPNEKMQDERFHVDLASKIINTFSFFVWVLK